MHARHSRKGTGSKQFTPLFSCALKDEEWKANLRMSGWRFFSVACASTSVHVSCTLVVATGLQKFALFRQGSRLPQFPRYIHRKPQCTELQHELFRDSSS